MCHYPIFGFLKDQFIIAQFSVTLPTNITARLGLHAFIFLAERPLQHLITVKLLFPNSRIQWT